MQILCEDKGLFLEIAEIIRAFGLNILKGKMEIRDNKLWGRFIVEVNTSRVLFKSRPFILHQTVHIKKKDFYNSEHLFRCDCDCLGTKTVVDIMVQGTRHVTRIEVFWYLVQLLQHTETSGMDNYQKTNLGIPMATT